MSADIQPAIRPSDPLALIRAAVRAASAAGIPVSTNPDMGVLCPSTHAPSWERDPRAPAISALGAVLIAHQPRIPLADEALAHVLGVEPIWTCGFDDAAEGKDPTASAVIRGPAVRKYADGFRAGAEFRALHAAPTASPDTETTNPVMFPLGRAPRTLIQQLLGPLTIADALDALADTLPSRRLSSEQLADIDEDLRDQASLYRLEGL